MSVPRRVLGGSDLSVSVFGLGSWRTWERVSRDQGARVLDQARSCGITFLEAVRYDDETGRAPIPTGHSEVVFGEIFRRSGWPRDEAIIATKLWWEFWPAQTAAGELEASLARIGIDHVDLVSCDPPPAALGLEEVVGAVTALIDRGLARAWGVVNWPPDALAAATRIAATAGLPAPCAVQLAYSAMTRDRVESPAMDAAMAGAGAGLVASYALGGGVLTGRHAAGSTAARSPAEVTAERMERAAPAIAALKHLADAWSTTPAVIAMAFALSHPRTAAVLFGATRPEQVRENVRAAELLDRLPEGELALLRTLGT